jgi:hypothetical protein
MPRVNRLGSLLSLKPTLATADGPSERTFVLRVLLAKVGRVAKDLAFDSELVLLASLLVALSGWFVLSLEPVATAESSRPLHVSTPAPGPAAEPFKFVSARSQDWLVPAMLAFEPRPQLRPLPIPGQPVSPPEMTASVNAIVEQHALLAEPLFDPLGSVVVSGLPKSSRLSAGAELTAQGAPTSDWAVAFGDLDNLVIAMPRVRTGPIRTTLDLHTRAGLKIASLTVEVRDQPSVASVVPARSPAKVRPARVIQSPAKTERKAIRATSLPETPKRVLIDPAKAPASAQPEPEPEKANTGILSLLPLGFFTPDPKDSASSGLSPDLRDDPRFTTLRGLGMAPSELLAAEPAPSTSSEN